MSWLRLDDRFTQHPKFSGWKPAERWAWLEVLEYCARYQTCGKVPEDVSLLPRSSSKTLLEKAVKSGLLDVENDGSRVVHDWQIYNGSSLEEKVSAYLSNHPNASANEVFRAVGGSRKAVLDLVLKLRADGTDNGTEPVPKRYETVVHNRYESGYARAVPSFGTTLSSTEGRDLSNPAQAARPSGGPPLADLAGFVRREWDNYPDLAVLADELTDRGATPDQAFELIDQERQARQTVEAEAS